VFLKVNRLALDYSNIWEVQSIDDGLTVYVRFGNELAHPTKINAVCETIEEKTRLLETVNFRRDKDVCLSYHDMIRVSYDQLNEYAEDINLEELGKSFRFNSRRKYQASFRVFSAQNVRDFDLF